MKGKKASKAASKYPFLAFRPSREHEARIRKLANKMTASLHRRVGVSEVIVTCIAARLPDLEAKYQGQP